MLDGHTADLIVVLARAPGSAGEDGLSFFTVPGDAPGLSRRALKVMDPTRKLARLEFDDVEARPCWARRAAAPHRSPERWRQAAACLANEMVGGAERLREDALDYAMMRVQFGRTIASFQSMKHKRPTCCWTWNWRNPPPITPPRRGRWTMPDCRRCASLAKAARREAYLQTAIHTIQIHGGIGFTWDNDTHLWFKRAKSFRGVPGRRRHWHRELHDAALDTC